MSSRGSEVWVGPELVALAGTAASSLVSAMAGDAWTQIRTRIGRLLGRGDQQTENRALDTLDEDAAALAASGGDAALARDISTQWTVRLRDLLRADPDAADALRGLVAELGAPVVGTLSGHGAVAAGDVNVTAEHGGVAAVTIEGGVHVGNPPQAGTGRA